MASNLTLLQQVVIADIETLSLNREGAIHEMSFWYRDSQILEEYLLTPAYVKVSNNSDEDKVRLRTKARQRHTLVEKSKWPNLIQALYGLDAQKFKTWEAAKQAIDNLNTFLGADLKSKKFAHLDNLEPTIEDVAKKRAAIDAFGGAQHNIHKNVILETLFDPGSDLVESLKGKTLWLANAQFESKQLGARFAAKRESEAAAGRKWQPAIRSILETQDPTLDDILNVTGKEVNAAKATAQQHGDWTLVHKAYKANPVKADELAVRDIQDVSRAVISYGRKLGLSSSSLKAPIYGTSIDVSFRMLAAAESDPEQLKKLAALQKVMGLEESHSSALDTRVHQDYVLEKQAQYAEVLEHVSDKTTEGQKYVQQAKAGEGPLPEIQRFLSMREAAAPELRRIDLVKRLARAQQGFLQADTVTQTTGVEAPRLVPHLDPSGNRVDIADARWGYESFTNMEDVVSHIEKSGDYAYPGIDVRAEYQALAAHVQPVVGEQAQATASMRYVDAFRDSNLKAAFERVQEVGPGAVRKMTMKQSLMALPEWLSGVAKHANVKSVGGAWAAGALAMGTIAGLWSVTHQVPAQKEPTLRAYNYDQWAEHQDSFYDMQGQGEGTGEYDPIMNNGGQFFGMQKPSANAMRENGLAGGSRKENTDFGSPYRGPWMSNYVLADQQLIQEREQYLRELYGVRHYDPIEGLFGLKGPFQQAFAGRGGYKFLPEGFEDIDLAQYPGLRKKNLKRIDLSHGDWKAEVEDADTIVVKRRGLRGGVSSFFGLNSGYKFRMAGIDAPETFHSGDKSYHAPQPYADEATEVLKSMLRGSRDIELVFDPSKTTYGRFMGVVFEGGKNLNTELVKQGAVTHLPFGNPQDSMVAWKPLKRSEDLAAQSGRGMWAHPWAQAFRDVSTASRTRLTLNTLARSERIVQQSSRMSMIGFMEQVEKNGQYTDADALAAAEIGQRMAIGGMGSDYSSRSIMTRTTATHSIYMDQMIGETGGFMRTKGRGGVQNKLSRRGGYGKLDKSMSIHTMRGGGSIWNKKQSAAYEMYGGSQYDRRKQKEEMAAMQRQANQQMFQSPIGHHRM